MASLDFNKQIGNTYLGILAEGFYTRLDNPFVNEFGEQDEDGTVVYTRVNAADGSIVKGVNLEVNFVPDYKLSLQSGLTIQTSEYEVKQEFGEKSFFRTPDSYGYFTLNWDPSKMFGFSATGSYAGSMLAPYFGSEMGNTEEGELRETDSFFDLGFKFRYNYVLNGASLQLFAGVKNILNSYQDDFDRGINRDPGYVYGPLNPRTIYVGLKIGNSI